MSDLEWLDLWRQEYPTCPRCRHQITQDLHEYNFDGEDEREIECPLCDVTFLVSEHISYTYTSSLPKDPR